MLVVFSFNTKSPNVSWKAGCPSALSAVARVLVANQASTPGQIPSNRSSSDDDDNDDDDDDTNDDDDDANYDAADNEEVASMYGHEAVLYVVFIQRNIRCYCISLK